MEDKPQVWKGSKIAVFKHAHNHQLAEKFHLFKLHQERLFLCLVLNYHQPKSRIDHKINLSIEMVDKSILLNLKVTL